jgi:methionyl-tRNA formyltransferase
LTVRVVTFGSRASELTTTALEAVGEVEEAEHVGHVEGGDASLVPDPNSAAGLRTLSELRPDLFLSSGYGLILREPALAIPTIGAINMHPSLLPAYRGSHPIFWAMYEVSGRWA